MVHATAASSTPSAASIVLNTTTPSVTDTSFTDQLAAALQKVLGDAKSGTQLEIDIQPASGQNSAAGQYLVTVKSPTAAPAANEVDAYWATQPPAVQALRDIPNDSDRMNMAHDLAAKGYAIDVPIMVWGWDPLTTMMIRQSYGYTWVPSATQPNIVAGPGISFPGAQDYDPAHPPAGSIKVSTDFAKGLESTSPWYRTFSSQS